MGMSTIWMFVIQELLQAIINVLGKENDARASSLKEEFAALQTKVEEMNA